MKNPGAANTGAFARNLVSRADRILAKPLTEINVNIADPISAHLEKGDFGFGVNSEG